MANDVKLKISGDASELIASIKSAMTQVQKEVDKLKVSTVAAGKSARPGVEAARDAERASRDLNKRIREEKAGLDSTNRELAKKEAQIARISKLEERGLDVANKRLSAERDLQAIQSRQQIQQANFNRAQEAMNRARGIGGGVAGAAAGGAGGGAGGGMFGALGIGMPATMMAGIYAAIKAGSAIESARKLYSEAPYRAREIEASAFNIQGQGGQRLRSIFGGGAPEELMFNQQRQQASASADAIMKSRLEAGSAMFSPHRLRQKIIGKSFAEGGLGTAGTIDQVRQEQQEEKAKIQEQQFEALKSGPAGAIRTAVGDKYLKDWRRNLDFQRQMGQTEGGFRNFLGGANAAGFTDEAGMGSASAIMGAGGSTRAAKGNAAFALQMGRQFDLTNAGQAMGAVSGQLGSAQLSKDALIKIQAEGTRIGVNQADFVEENRKFVEMAAGVINQSNVTSGAGVEQVLSTLSNFMGSKTMTGMEAGKSAYEMYQRQSNIQTGPSAVMRAAGMRGDEVLGKLSERERGMLSQMPEKEITVDSETVQGIASRSGLSPQQIVDSYRKVIGKSLFVNQSTDEAINRLKEAKQKFGPLASGTAYAQQFQNIKNLRGRAMGEVSLEGAFAGSTEKQRMAAVDAQSSSERVEKLTDIEEEIRKQAEAGKTKRPGDETERQTAEASRMMNELFTSIKESIEPASAQTAEFTKQINALVVAMKGGDVAAIAAAQRALGNAAPGTPMAPSTQTTTGTGGAPGP